MTAEALREWEQALNEALRDGALYLHEELKLRELQSKLGLTDADLSPLLPLLHRVKTITHARGGMLEPVGAPFPLWPGEVAYVVREAEVHDSKTRQEWVKGFQGMRGFNLTVHDRIPVGRGRFAVTSRRFRVDSQMWIDVAIEEVYFASCDKAGVCVELYNRKVPIFLDCQEREYAAAALNYASRAKGEVRPLCGWALIYDLSQPSALIRIFPDEATLAYYESVKLAEREDEAASVVSRLPAVPGGTVVTLGAPAGEHIGFRIERGPFAGRTGYVDYEFVHVAR